jgi:hypothetical protein
MVSVSHFLLFPDSPEAQKVKKRPRVELVSYASSPEKQSCGRSSPDSDSEMFDGQMETLHAQHKASRDGRLADAVTFGSQPVNPPPLFSTANTSNETLPIASDAEHGDYSNSEPQGQSIPFDSLPVSKNPPIHSLTKSSFAASIPYDSLPMSKNPPIHSLTKSFFAASIGNDMPIADEQTSDGRQMIGANRHANHPIAPISFGSSTLSATDKQESHNMRSVLREKIHDTAKAMSEEEKLRYDQLRERKRMLVSGKVGAAGPSSVTRKYSRCSINTRLSHTYSHTKALLTFVSHRFLVNLTG